MTSTPTPDRDGYPALARAINLPATRLRRALAALAGCDDPAAREFARQIATEAAEQLSRLAAAANRAHPDRRRLDARAARLDEQLAAAHARRRSPNPRHLPAKQHNPRKDT